MHTTPNLDDYSLTDLDTYAMKLRDLRDDYRASGDDTAASVQLTLDAVRDAMQDRLTGLVGA